MPSLYILYFFIVNVLQTFISEFKNVNKQKEVKYNTKYSFFVLSKRSDGKGGSCIQIWISRFITTEDEGLWRVRLTLSHGGDLLLNGEHQLGLPGQILAPQLLVLEGDGYTTWQVVHAVDDGEVCVGLCGAQRNGRDHETICCNTPDVECRSRRKSKFDWLVASCDVGRCASQKQRSNRP